MSDQEKTPLEVAREVWGLEWTEDGPPTDDYHLMSGMADMLGILVEYARLDGDSLGWEVSTTWGSWEADDLPTALTQARDDTLTRLEAAAALCRDPAKEERDRWLGVHAPEVHRPPGHVDALGDDETEEDAPAAEDYVRILARVEEGHTVHCAKRLVWGDGECECALSRGPEYHTLNPPPGGFKMDAQGRLWSELRLLVERAEALVANVEDYRARPDDRSPPSLALTRRLRKRLDHARATLDSTKGKTPIPVAIHPGTGEAVLMLTNEDGAPLCATASSIHHVDDHTEGGAFIVFDGEILEAALEVRESAEDIRATLRALAERQGGEE